MATLEMLDTGPGVILYMLGTPPAFIDIAPPAVTPPIVAPITPSATFNLSVTVNTPATLTVTVS